MTTTPRGFAFLFLIIVIAAISVAVSFAASVGGVAAGTRVRSYKDGATTRMLAMRCGETVLMQVQAQPTLVNSGTLTIGSDSCTYAITGTSAPKTITITATHGVYVERMTLTITATSPNLAVQWIQNA